MITKTLLIAALSLVAAGSALANELTPDFSKLPASTLTRAAVIAEYVRAKDAGELIHDHGYKTVTDTPTRSVLTRADVQREYLRARDAGEIALAEGPFVVPQHARHSMQ